MAKVVLLSVVIAIIVIPVLAARDPNPFRSLRKVALVMLVFNLLYLLATRYIYPHLL